MLYGGEWVAIVEVVGIFKCMGSPLDQTGDYW